ncbi:hypothetical protein BDV59DRAFT_181826 [Aspergillus ambiguus]|uniref:uncharacterized protein n=1 Tax=Aspergillus ambiguus TaxID=176160 RepID=UPI003CCDD9D4
MWSNAQTTVQTTMALFPVIPVSAELCSAWHWEQTPINKIVGSTTTYPNPSCWESAFHLSQSTGPSTHTTCTCNDHSGQQ